MSSGITYNLLTNATATATGDALSAAKFPSAEWGEAKNTYQATVTGTGAVTATVIIEASNDAVNYLPLATITLSGTGSASDGFVSDAPWAYFRARLTAISGTGALVSVILGV